MKKRSVLIVISLALIVCSLLNVNALGIDQKELDRALPRGVTFSSDLSSLEKDYILENKALLDELSQDAGEIVSVEKVVTNLYDPLVDQEEKSAPTTRAIDNFSITVVAQRINDRPDDDNFKFIAVGDWAQDPSWDLVDALGIAWSDSFTLYDDDCYVVIDGGTKLRGYVDLVEQTPEAGLVYEIDLRVQFEEDDIVLVGYVYKDDSSGSANITAKYGHQSIGLSSITASVSSTPSVGLSVGFGSTLDTESAYDSFDY